LSLHTQALSAGVKGPGPWAEAKHIFGILGPSWISNPGPGPRSGISNAIPRMPLHKKISFLNAAFLPVPIDDTATQLVFSISHFFFISETNEVTNLSDAMS
jgi:hypothetical protein